MRIWYFFFVAFILSSIPSFGQTLQGSIRDLQNSEYLSNATIRNITNGKYTFSNTKGSFLIAAVEGDTLQVTLTGYESKTVYFRNTPTVPFIVVSLQPKNVLIDTVTITPGLTNRQIDSLENRIIYGKKVTEKPAKFKRLKPHSLYGGSGKGLLNYDAPISSLIQKRTKKYKRLKAFQDRFIKDETQSFIDSRYTTAMVAELTLLQGDSLQFFMNTYPMPLDLAKNGSELEMKSWVKYNYKVWMGMER